MADVTISNLEPGTPSSSDVIPFSTGSSTRKASIAQIVAFASSIPQGGIIMWSGSIASIPAGWALCNGQSGTPNLQNRFIVASGSTYTPGSTGSGSASYTQIDVAANGHVHSQWDCSCQYYINTQGNNSSVSINSVNSMGLVPDYYALAYIMKL